MEKKPLDLAYFSMEVALDDRFHNYAGGLGVLAADTLYACADNNIPAVGVTLWYHQNDEGENVLHPDAFMKRRPETIEVQIEDRHVKVAIWEYEVRGASGRSIPLLFLSSYLPENKRWDRDLTKNLYASDRYTRLGQEAILGIGGHRALHACGYEDVRYYHMNEGHTALINLERLRNHGYDYDVVRKKSTFTTHTPIAAGHDYFDYELAHASLGDMLPQNIRDLATHDRLGMTQLAMSLSCRTNAVSRTHRDVTRDMFPGQEIEYVTNGVYHPRWVGNALANLYDETLTGWRETPSLLSTVFAVPNDKIQSAMRTQKTELIDWLNTEPRCFCKEGAQGDDIFDTETLTIGFARRFVPYKRPQLIFKNLDRLREIGYRKLQFVFAGRCHPDDAFCNQLRETIAHYDCELRGQVKVIVIQDYNLDIAKRLVTGVDVWLNNPVPPREASGTSGMKAALNGALNLSILDGWWVEGFEMHPKAGWGVKGALGESDENDHHDNEELLSSLNDAISCYYDRKEEWHERAKHSIALGAHFNTTRMLNEYREKMWR